MKMPRCFILLGGQGTRLFPLTDFIHKSMIPVRGRPVLEYIVQGLKEQGITDMVFCVSILSTNEQFMYYFGDGSKQDVSIRYSVGPKMLNTAGRILKAKNLINDTFIVYYGDILTNLDLKQTYAFHREKNGIGTVVFSPSLPTASGIGVLDSNLRIKEVREKPLLPFPTSIGVYILEPKILTYIRPEYDFFQDVFPLAIKHEENIYGYVSDCHWLDIGTFRNLQRAESFVKQNFGATVKVLGKV